jgi:hypothetical protein
MFFGVPEEDFTLTRAKPGALHDNPRGIEPVRD